MNEHYLHACVATWDTRAGAHVSVWYAPLWDYYLYDTYAPSGAWVESAQGYETIESVLRDAQRAVARASAR
jgi:hypothetical protein